METTEVDKLDALIGELMALSHGRNAECLFTFVFKCRDTEYVVLLGRELLQRAQCKSDDSSQLRFAGITLLGRLLACRSMAHQVPHQHVCAALNGLADVLHFCDTRKLVAKYMACAPFPLVCDFLERQCSRSTQALIVRYAQKRDPQLWDVWICENDFEDELPLSKSFLTHCLRQMHDDPEADATSVQQIFKKCVLWDDAELWAAMCALLLKFPIVLPTCRLPMKATAAIAQLITQSPLLLLQKEKSWYTVLIAALQKRCLWSSLSTALNGVLTMHVHRGGHYDFEVALIEQLGNLKGLSDEWHLYLSHKVPCDYFASKHARKDFFHLPRAVKVLTRDNDYLAERFTIRELIAQNYYVIIDSESAKGQLKHWLNKSWVGLESLQLYDRFTKFLKGSARWPMLYPLLKHYCTEAVSQPEAQLLRRMLDGTEGIRLSQWDKLMACAEHKMKKILAGALEPAQRAPALIPSGLRRKYVHFDALADIDDLRIALSEGAPRNVSKVALSNFARRLPASHLPEFFLLLRQRGIVLGTELLPALRRCDYHADTILPYFTLQAQERYNRKMTAAIWYYRLDELMINPPLMKDVDVLATQFGSRAKDWLMKLCRHLNNYPMHVQRRYVETMLSLGAGVNDFLAQKRFHLHPWIVTMALHAQGFTNFPRQLTVPCTAGSLVLSKNVVATIAPLETLSIVHLCYGTRCVSDADFVRKHLFDALLSPHLTSYANIVALCITRLMNSSNVLWHPSVMSMVSLAYETHMRPFNAQSGQLDKVWRAFHPILV